MGAFAYRILGAAMLDAGMYEGIESDRRATRQAAVMVVLSSLAAGVGAGGWHGPGLATTLVVALIALATWMAWAMLVFQIGTRWLPEPTTDATLDELLRTIGFAAAPGLLQVFAAFPRVRVLAFAAAWIWMFGAMVIAVKHALDFQSTAHTLTVCVLAALLPIGLAVVLGLIFGPALS